MGGPPGQPGGTGGAAAPGGGVGGAGATTGWPVAGFTSATPQLGQTVRPSYHRQQLTQTSCSVMSPA